LTTRIASYRKFKAKNNAFRGLFHYLEEVGGAAMEAEKAIRTRRSIRTFEETPVDEDDLQGMLEAGRWAPSGLNNQPWRVVVVRDRKMAGKLASFTKYSSIVEAAPLILAVFLDLAASYDRDKDAMALGAFIQNILLAAHARGLGAVWLGEILKNKDEVRDTLKVAPGFELMAVIAAGKPARPVGDGSRREISEIILEEYL
jgi:nitroreductase